MADKHRFDAIRAIGVILVGHSYGGMVIKDTATAIYDLHVAPLERERDESIARERDLIRMAEEDHAEYEALERVKEAADQWTGDDCEAPIPVEIVGDEDGDPTVRYRSCGWCRVCLLCRALDTRQEEDDG